jgi:hypothetical protein
MRRASIDHRDQAKKSFVCLLIIFVTEKGLDKCTRAILVDAVIDLVLFSPKYTITYTCHDGHHSMLRNDCTEVSWK